MTDKANETHPLGRPGFIVSAVAVAALVAGVVFLAVYRSSGGSDSAAGLASLGWGTSSFAPVQECSMPSGDRSIPAKLSTTGIGAGDDLAVPAMSGVGPGFVQEGEVTRCFAHSPTGAILAAANFMVWFSSMQQLPSVVEQLTASGSDQDRMLADIAASWDGAGAVPLSIRGFYYEDRGADDALVVLAVSPDGVNLVAWPLPMVWQEGDWKVTLPTSENWGERAITSLQLEGFIEWRP